MMGVVPRLLTQLVMFASTRGGRKPQMHRFKRLIRDSLKANSVNRQQPNRSHVHLRSSLGQS